MPLWNGPQTHQEAPGSSNAIQHEIKRQSPRKRRGELYAGVISGAHVRSPVLHRLCTPYPLLPTPSKEDTCCGSPAWPRDASDPLHCSLNPVEHGLLDPVGYWKLMSLVAFINPENTKHKRRGKKAKKCSVMNMH